MNGRMTSLSFLGRSTLVALVLAVATTAGAQSLPDQGGKVFGIVGGSFGDGNTAVVSSGGAGIRVTRHLGIDFEVSHVTGLDFSDDHFFVQRLTFVPPIRIKRDGGLTLFLTNFDVAQVASRVSYRF